MIDVLVDTNIVIYLMEDDPENTGFIMRMGGDVRFGISILSYMELLLGLSSPEDHEFLEFALKPFIILPLDIDIARDVASTLQKRSMTLRNPMLADMAIAHTALRHGIPLVTNNPKDFRRFRGLKVLSPKMSFSK